MENTEISRHTHIPVKGASGLIIQNNQLLLQDVTSKIYFFFFNTTNVNYINVSGGDVIYVPLSDEIINIFQIVTSDTVSEVYLSESINSDETNEEETVVDAKLWTRPAVLFLIKQVENYQNDFENGLKKNIWIKISQKCSENFSKHITYNQCDMKWKSLKRTYKSILLHNTTSGKERKRWEYFDVIHNFMFTKPEITPQATCSSIKGLSKNINCQRNDDTVPSAFENKENEERDPNFESSFTKKRKLRLSQCEKRHKKLARMDRFNDLFEKYVEKL